jgi:hypothetical protein
MWRPKERIKYKPQPGPWPTREEAESSLLFSPVNIGPISLRQRTWVPAMVPWRATEDGFMTEELLDWYGRYAEGRPGAIVVEATGIRDIPSGPLLRIGHDRFIPGLKKLVDKVREASDGETRLFIQIIDFLRINRRPLAEKYFQKYLQVTDEHRAYFYEKLSDDEIRAKFLELNDEALQDALTKREYEAYAYGYRERVTDTHLPHIEELPQTKPVSMASNYTMRMLIRWRRFYPRETPATTATVGTCRAVRGSRSKSTGRYASRSATITSLVAATCRKTASNAAPRWKMGLTSASNLRKPVWTSFHCLAAASSRTRNNPR